MTELTIGNLLDGSMVAPADGMTIDVRDPASNRVVGRVPAMRAEDLSAVFDAAERGSFAWRATSHIERGKVLLAAGQLVRGAASELTDIIVREMGKTRAEATGEVDKAAEFFEYYGGLARQPFGEMLPDARPGTFATQLREPLGIVVLITPWNDPLLTPARKLAPALLAGNAVVIKPSTETPIVTLKLAELLTKAGLPAGVLGTVTGWGADVGAALVRDPRIRAVSFTGSTEVGLDLQRRLAGVNIRLQTEMGGKNAAVVLDDADLDIAVPTIMSAAYGQAGQRCTATSRLIVQRGIATVLRERLSAAVQNIAIGRGADPGTTMGPVVSVRAKQDISARVAAALDEGAEVIATAHLSEEQAAAGAFVAPVLLSVSTSNSIWRDEVFGPVVAMTLIDTLDEAIALVNESAYGLSSAVFTRDLASAFHFIDRVDTGQVSVNQPTSGWDVHEPFGGFKDSGSPFKEQGSEALRFYSRVKTAAIRTGS